MDEHIHQQIPHEHTQTKAVLNRLSRAQGHLESVRRMVERGEDCTEVLVQLSAVISALNSTGRVILKDHITHCIVNAMEENDIDAMNRLDAAIDRFMR
ncbi:MAG: metal-sensing transcriptional repressor [Clostridiales bacterium]|nr:metal-sensing transcriptional repressor [Candidatus Cacconaster stercorequi]